MSPQLEPAVARSAGTERGKGSNRQRSEGRSLSDLPPLRLADLPSEYVSIDPGAVHCGVGRWCVDTADDGVKTVTLVESYERSPDALYIELRDLKADGVGLVICEDFMVQKNRIRQGARLPTVKVIGVIEYLCRRNNLEVRLQAASIKSSVDAWLRVKAGLEVDGRGSAGSPSYQPPLASNSHKRDSIRHGLYPALRDKRDREAVRLVLTDHTTTRGRPKPKETS